MMLVSIEHEDSVMLAAGQLRDLLPDAISKEAWIAETSVEYIRYLHLLSLDDQNVVQPALDSLLGEFVKITNPSLLNHDNINAIGHDKYKAVFGHLPPYNWTASIASLFSDDAGPAPGAA